jgi:hypothetical protein
MSILMARLSVGLEAMVTLSSLDVTLPLSEIYRMVDFEQNEGSQSPGENQG